MTEPATRHRPARRRNRRGEGGRLREDLLAAAAELVEEAADPAAVTLRAVADRVGVTAPAVYLHFTDIDALKLAVTQRAFTEFAAARDRAADGIDDPVHGLIVRCQAYARYAVDHPGAYRLMTGPELPRLAAPDDSTAPSVRALQGLARSIDACQVQGLAPRDLAPDHLAALVWSALHGQVRLRTDRPGFPWPPLERDVEHLLRRLVGLPPGEPPS